MNIIQRIAYGCDIARDPEQNRINHQRMVDTLNAIIAGDGWSGVKVAAFHTVDGSSFVEIEPGISALTLDYLRGLKEAGREIKAEPPAAIGEQGRLV